MLGVRRAAARAWPYAVCLALFGAVGPARAQPLVRVRSQTRVELAAEPGDRGVLVRGRVLDDAGAGLGDRVVQLTVTPEATEAAREQRLAVRTDSEGAFSTVLSLPSARYGIRASFAEEPLQAAASDAQTFDLTKLGVELAFVQPSDARVDLERPAIAVVVHARSRAGGQSLPLAVTDETGRALVQGSTGPDGAFRASLRSAQLGPPGRGRLVAHSLGDGTRREARVAIELLRFVTSTLSLRAEQDRASGALVLSGRLAADKKPLAHKAVGLFDGSEHVASVLTDGGGAFRYRLPPAAPGSEEHVLNLQARYQSDAPWFGSSRSRLLRLTHRGAPAQSAWPLAGVVALCAIALWLLQRREVAQRPRTAAAWGAGVHMARERTRVLRSARKVAGEVRDAQTQRPIAGAELALVHQTTGASCTLVADGEGRFGSDALPEGKWSLRVAAHGYRGVSTELTVPHRGQWSALHVGLQSLRHLARLAYKPAAVRRLRSPAWFEQLTPRETLEAVEQQGRAEPAFVELTRLIERALYAKRSPTEDDVAAIEAATRAASPHLPPKASSQL